MKRIVSLIACTVMTVYASVPMSGDRVWDIAAQDLAKISTVDSKVDLLQDILSSTVTGTSTLFDDLVVKSNIVLSQSEQLESKVSALYVPLANDASALCAVDSKLDVIDSRVDQVDTLLASALDGLKTTVCSKLDLLHSDLDQASGAIAGLYASDVDRSETIASKLQVIEQDVEQLDTNLDTITISSGNAVSVLDLVLTVESKVDALQVVITTDFAGTFTSLDTNLAKGCTIESLADAIIASSAVDVTDIYSALEDLNQKICTTDSLADVVQSLYEPLLESVCVLESSADQATSQICVTESKADALACNECFSIIDHDAQSLWRDCSLLDGLTQNQFMEKTSTIDSTLDVVEQHLLMQQSQLAIVSSEMEVVESKVCDISLHTAESKVAVINSKVDVYLQDVTTLSSTVDEVAQDAATIESKVCALDSNVSAVCALESTVNALNSSIDGSAAIENLTESKLSMLVPAQESVVDQLKIIGSALAIVESKVCAIDVQPLESKLARIEQDLSSIDTNDDQISSLIDADESKLNALQQDVIATWTILQTITDKLCTDESLLEAINIDIVADADLDGTQTLIAAITNKACTIESKVDGLMLNASFNGTFTLLDRLESKVCLIDDLVQTTSTDVEVIQDALGIAIFNSDVPLTITQAGRYYLAEDISTAGGDAITIATSNVYLDFNAYTLVSSAGQGVVMNDGFTNIVVANGTIGNTMGNAVHVGLGCKNIVVRDVQVEQTTSGHGIELTSSIDVLIDRVAIQNATGSGLSISNGKNTRVRSSIFASNTQDGISCANNFENGYFDDISVVANGAHGIDGDTVANLVFNRITNQSNTANGFNLLNMCNDLIIQECVSQWNAIGLHLASSSVMQNMLLRNAILDSGTAGVRLNGSDNIMLFNDLSQNGLFNFDEQTGVNTYLGNYAFDCNGNNFSTAGSNLTDKKVDITQVTPFTIEPTQWHNVDMAVGPSAASQADKLLTKACDVESGVDTTSSYADEVASKVCLIQSDINLSESVVDTIAGSGDLSQLDAVIASLRADAQALEAQILSTITTLESSSPCIGTPIDPSGTPYTAITISSSGNYYLTQGGSQRIVIAANAVKLNMNGHSLFGDGTNNGITINNGLENVTVYNGALVGWNRGVTFNNGRYHTFDDLLCRDSAETNFYIGGGNVIHLANIKAIGSQSLENIRIQGGNQVLLNYCIAAEGAGGGVYVANVSQIEVLNCIAIQNTGDGFRGTSSGGPGALPLYVFENCKATLNSANGFNVTGGNDNRTIDILNCTSLQNNVGIAVSRPGVNVKQCIASRNTTNGILLTGAADGVTIQDNVMLRNGTINYQDNSGNTSTVLGNFAYQITTPANNYTVSSGTLPIVQATIAAPFSTRPTRWHNVSMIN